MIYDPYVTLVIFHHSLYKIRNETPSPRHSPLPDADHLNVNTYNGEHK